MFFLQPELQALSMPRLGMPYRNLVSRLRKPTGCTVAVGLSSSAHQGTGKRLQCCFQATWVLSFQVGECVHVSSSYV